MINNSNLSFLDNKIKQKYGSRKGLLYFWVNKILFHFGWFNRRKKIDWPSIDRLVFVCQGNICRSAYADVLARSEGIESCSFGLNTVDGAKANDRAILMAEKLDCSLLEHRTTTYKKMVFTDKDLVIVMEPAQLRDVINRTENRYQYTLLGLWGRVKSPYIHDPYSSSEEYFETCFNVIEAAVYAIIQEVRAVKKK